MSIIDEIRITYAPIVDSTGELPPRSLIQQIDWRDRLIGIMGPKGVGKTTILMQRMLEDRGGSLYFSLDHPLASVTSALSIAQQFSIEGGKYLFFDEVHKYPNWSTELKSIFDTLPSLRLVFSGSSAVRLSAQGGDLSRRASIYSIPVLSLREFVELETGNSFKAVEISEIIKGHEKLAQAIVSRIKPIPLFKRYLEYGAYPFYREGLAKFPEKLRAAVLYTIESDLVQVHQLDPRYIPKLKKLLRFLAGEVPYTPNISALAQSLDVSRATTLRYLELLELGGVLALLQRQGRGYQKISKPEKVFLDNPNLMQAFGMGNLAIGTLRETFLLNQLRASGQEVVAPLAGEFLVNGRHTFEVGGRNKKTGQIAGTKDAYVVRDDIEIGSGNIVPLWLFGFLY